MIVPPEQTEVPPHHTAPLIKTRRSAPAGFFQAEAAGLTWLAEAVPTGGVPVVEVLDTGPGHISLQRLIEIEPTRRAAEEFGRRLAATHEAGAESFGVGPTGGPGVAWIGRQELDLGRRRRWGGFYADLRVLPYARAALKVGNLSRSGFARVERVSDRLRTGEFDDDRPVARIHGDLWTGNVLWTEHGGTLIDPAAHGGHGQTDLAMLALFGAPYLASIEAAYAEAAVLPADWPERTGLHQLHPLLVHAVSHGASYGAAADRIAHLYA